MGTLKIAQDNVQSALARLEEALLYIENISRKINRMNQFIALALAFLPLVTVAADTSLINLTASLKELAQPTKTFDVLSFLRSKKDDPSWFLYWNEEKHIAQFSVISQICGKCFAHAPRNTFFIQAILTAESKTEVMKLHAQMLDKDSFKQFYSRGKKIGILATADDVLGSSHNLEKRNILLLQNEQLLPPKELVSPVNITLSNTPTTPLLSTIIEGLSAAPAALDHYSSKSIFWSVRDKRPLISFIIWVPDWQKHFVGLTTLLLDKNHWTFLSDSLNIKRFETKGLVESKTVRPFLENEQLAARDLEEASKMFIRVTANTYSPHKDIIASVESELKSCNLLNHPLWQSTYKPWIINNEQKLQELFKKN